MQAESRTHGSSEGFTPVKSATCKVEVGKDAVSVQPQLKHAPLHRLQRYQPPSHTHLNKSLF